MVLLAIAQILNSLALIALAYYTNSIYRELRGRLRRYIDRNEFNFNHLHDQVELLKLDNMRRHAK